MIFSNTSTRTIALKAVTRMQHGSNTTVCRRNVIAAAAAVNGITTNVLQQQQQSYFVSGRFIGFLARSTTNTVTKPTIVIPQCDFSIRRPLPLSYNYSPSFISCSTVLADISTTDTTAQFVCTTLYNFVTAVASATKNHKTLQLTNFSSSSFNQQVVPYCSDDSPAFLLGLLITCISNLLTRFNLLREMRKYVQDKETLNVNRNSIRSCFLKEFKKFYNKRQRFNSKDKLAFRRYTGNGYIKINGALRKGVGSKEFEKEQRLIDAVLLAMSKTGLENYDGTVYCGVKLLPSKMMNDLVPGATFTDPGFLSTSCCKDVVHNAFTVGSGGVFFKIQSRTGVNVSDYSKHKQEKEILFRPSTMFRILSVEEINGYHSVVMKEI